MELRAEEDAKQGVRRQPVQRHQKDLGENTGTGMASRSYKGDSSWEGRDRPPGKSGLCLIVKIQRGLLGYRMAGKTGPVCPALDVPG